MKIRSYIGVLVVIAAIAFATYGEAKFDFETIAAGRSKGLNTGVAPLNKDKAAPTAVCPGGPGPTCIELRVENPPVSTNTPTFTDGAIFQIWPTPGVPGCLPDVTPNWVGPLINVDSTAPVAPPIQTCYNNGALWVKSGRDTGAMVGSQCINDLENVSFDAPAGKLFTSVSIELKCAGPATRLHDVAVYYYPQPGVLCEFQLIEPPLYAAKPHGAPGVNSYILDTLPSSTSCAAGFRRIEIEPQIGSACSVVMTNGFRTASVPLTELEAIPVWPVDDVKWDLDEAKPDEPNAPLDMSPTGPGVICGAPDPTAAMVTVSGRVLTPSGQGVSGAIVYVIDQSGISRNAGTNQFGYYRFEDIQVGQTLIVNAYSKAYQFTAQVVNVEDSISDLNFIAQGQNDLKQRE